MKLFYGVIILLSAMVVGCVPVTPTNNNQSQLFTSSIPLNEIEFLDTGAFDSDLSSSMRAAISTITVTTLSPVTVNEIPERLEKWLAAVRENGGTINIEPKTKSLVSVVGLLFSMLDEYSYLFNTTITNNQYSASVNYNVLISYQPDNGIIDNIQFIIR